MKECFKCGVVKELSEFYTHKQMADGHLNKCKDCTRIDVDRREKKLRQENPEWVEAEQARARDKYRRLGYKERHYELAKEKRPYQLSSTCKNLHRDLKLSNLEVAHHWNYNQLKDAIIIDKALHRKLHTLITPHEKLFKVRLTGELLDTREKHEQFIESISQLLFT